jgi:predicted nucleotidyltransferase component of viral defense system
MIPRRYIEEWKANAPWPLDAQIEQDLVIERALVEIFSDEFICKSLALRGGTALHKIFMKPQARYSEDIDLVQITPEPINPVLIKIREKLKFLGLKRSVKQNDNNNTIIYRFESEVPPIVNLRLKIEINCREHFNVLGYKKIPFAVENSWFSGSCNVISYELEELLGTKLRALYQRRKGRDLFDLYWAMKHNVLDVDKIISCYKEYMSFVVKQPPTAKMFTANMEEKIQDPEFKGDIHALLRPGIKYEDEKAYEFIKTNLLEKI